MQCEDWPSHHGVILASNICSNIGLLIISVFYLLLTFSYLISFSGPHLSHFPFLSDTFICGLFIYLYPRYPVHFWSEKSKKTLGLPESCIQDFRASQTHVVRDLLGLPLIHLSNIYTGSTMSKDDIRDWEFWNRNCSTFLHGLYYLKGNKMNNCYIVRGGIIGHCGAFQMLKSYRHFRITFSWEWSS